VPEETIQLTARPQQGLETVSAARLPKRATPRDLELSADDGVFLLPLDAFATAPEEPTQIGPYRVLERVGSGGMGIVYRVRREGSDRDLALKLLIPAYAAFAKGRARFLREAKVAADMSHPHVIRVHDLGEHDRLPYMVLDFVPGGSLHDRIEREDTLPLRDAARIVQQIALGLQHAHGRGLIHRDLKPANILLGADGPLLTDFGLCKRLESDSKALTSTGQILGTPAYMPPEQVRGQAMDARADVYSLGATLYEALTGCAPFERDSAILLLQAALSEPPLDPRALRLDLDPELKAICLRCLEKDPRDRYQTAGELAQALGTWLAASGSGERRVRLQAPRFLRRLGTKRIRIRSASRDTKTICRRRLAEFSSGNRPGYRGNAWALPLAIVAGLLMCLAMLASLQSSMEPSRSTAGEVQVLGPPGTAPWQSALDAGR
jgi:serine/threonine protein kinase